MFSKRCVAAFNVILGNQNPKGLVHVTQRSVAAAIEAADIVAAETMADELKIAIDEAVAPYVVQRNAAVEALCQLFGPVLESYEREMEFATVEEDLRWRSALVYCSPEAQKEMETALELVGPRAAPADVIVAYRDAATIVRTSGVEFAADEPMTSDGVKLLVRYLLDSLADEIEHRADPPSLKVESLGP